MTRLTVFALALAASACATTGVPKPVSLAAGQEACRSCRMTISSTRTAAQVVAPNEEPLFFDDIGCLCDYLREHRLTSPRAAAYVVDHRNGQWIAARQATYVRVATVDTPMGSHVLAFVDAASRDAEPAARQAQPLEARVLFDGIGLPGDTQ
jgi:copper chaperone NosL